MALTPAQKRARQKALEQARKDMQRVQTAFADAASAAQAQVNMVRQQIADIQARGAAPTVTPPAGGTTLEVTGGVRSAAQEIRDTLALYGLENLAPLIEGFLTKKEYRLPDGSLATSLIWDQIRGSEPYRQRFGAKIARDNFIQSEIRAGRTPSMAPISEADQLKLEQQYRTIAAQRGLPANFYDNVGDFTTLITNDISPDEFDQRVSLAYEASVLAPPEVKAALKTRYGLGDNDIMALYLDPEKAKSMVTGGTLGELTRAVNTAAVQATGLVGGERAEQLAREFAPGTELLKTREFTEAAGALAPLTRTSIEGVASVATGEDVLRAVMGQQAAKGRLEQERRRRVSEYEAGGGVATTGQGAVGLRTTTM